MSVGKAREYVVARDLGENLVYAIGLEDDLRDDTRFAIAAQRASIRVGEMYPSPEFRVSQITPITLGNPDGINIEMRNASEFIGK